MNFVTRVASELYPGQVVRLAERTILIRGAAQGEPLFGPPVQLRPGYRFFLRPDWLLPDQVVDDLGQVYLGREAWDFIEAYGDAFPRADVIGCLPDGREQTVFMKELDLVETGVFAAPPGGVQWTRLDLALVSDPAVAPTPFDSLLDRLA